VDEQREATREDWDKISLQLREPFDPSDVDFRVQGRVSEQNNRAQVLAYIDARAVQDRLDAVVGCGNWSFDWSPIVSDNGEVMVAKGTLTIYGISKSDAGSASNFEQSLGAVSHCFKRAAVQWGIGRYLYSLPASWVSVERGGRIPEAVLRQLRSALPQPGGRTAQVAEEREQYTVQETSTSKTRQRPVAAIREPASEARYSASQSSETPATEQQLTSIRKLSAALGKEAPAEAISYTQARELLSQLSGEYRRSRQQAS
jgi:hypothetical protein